MREKYTNKKEGDPEDQRMEESFTDFVRTGQYTKNELQEAYLRILGVRDITKDSTRIDELEREMDRMTRNRYPLNRINSFIDSMESISNEMQKFIEFVNELPLSEKEKKVIKSIVKERRSGQLDILSQKDSKTLMECKVTFPSTPPDDGGRAEVEVSTDTLKEAFSKIPKIPIAITFSEK